MVDFVAFSDETRLTRGPAPRWPMSPGVPGSPHAPVAAAAPRGWARRLQHRARSHVPLQLHGGVIPMVFEHSAKKRSSSSQSSSLATMRTRADRSKSRWPSAWRAAAAPQAPFALQARATAYGTAP